MYTIAVISTLKDLDNKPLELKISLNFNSAELIFTLFKGENTIYGIFNNITQPLTLGLFTYFEKGYYLGIEGQDIIFAYDEDYTNGSTQ